MCTESLVLISMTQSGHAEFNLLIIPTTK